GTGKWVHRAFTVPAVDLKGLNTGSLEGGPRLIFQNGQVFVSRVELGIYRTGTNALAGLDPIPDCFEDPKICTDAYGNYAELDLGKAVMNGLDVGSSGGDQLMVTEETGPANDRRQDAYFELPDVNFSGVTQGPQAAARFAIIKPTALRGLPGVYFTRLRYAVIRPCGPMAGVNLLEGCKPPAPASSVVVEVRPG